MNKSKVTIKSEALKDTKFNFGCRFLDVDCNGTNKITLDTSRGPFIWPFFKEQEILKIINLGEGDNGIAIQSSKEIIGNTTEKELYINYSEGVVVRIKPSSIFEVDSKLLRKIVEEMYDDGKVYCDAREDENQEKKFVTDSMNSVTIQVTKMEAYEIVDSVVGNMEKIPIEIVNMDRLLIYSGNIDQGWKVKIYQEENMDKH